MRFLKYSYSVSRQKSFFRSTKISLFVHILCKSFRNNCVSRIHVKPKSQCRFGKRPSSRISNRLDPLLFSCDNIFYIASHIGLLVKANLLYFLVLAYSVEGKPRILQRKESGLIEADKILLEFAYLSSYSESLRV